MNHTRLHGLRQLLREHGCTHLLVSDATDVRYVTGFQSSNALLLVSSRRNLLLTDFRYIEAARRFCRNEPAWAVVEITEGNFSVLKGLVRPGATLGVQSASLTVDQLDRIRKVLRGVRIAKLQDAVSALGIAKTEREAALIRTCARIGDRALQATARQLRLGMTEAEAAQLLEQHCRDRGSEQPAFETIALFGARTALPHGRPGSHRLRRGDFILFDFGCCIDGMRSDMTRTLAAGRTSRRQREIYQTVLDAQRTARGAIRAGMACREADRLARDVIEKAGYGPHFGHATGHGVGYRIHEAPRVGSTSKEVLPVGAVVTVEPGIYIENFGGVRIEDMVYLRRGRTEVLTRFPRNLIELDL